MVCPPEGQPIVSFAMLGSSRTAHVRFSTIGMVMTEDEVLRAFADTVNAAGLAGKNGTLGIGDDCAVVPISGSLVTSVDVVVEGVHADFSLTTLGDFGWRAVGAALSDLAAMGVAPLGLLSSVVTSDFDAFHLLGDGIVEAAQAFSCPILGGDVSRGPLWSVSITVFGETKGKPVPLRSGAMPGDVLVVTGSIYLLGEVMARLEPQRGPGEGRLQDF